MFNAKAMELVKEKYPDEPSIFELSQRWFEGYCRRSKISYEEKLTQLKSHHQLYVPLLRDSMQSLYESAKEELSHLRIWVT